MSCIWIPKTPTLATGRELPIYDRTAGLGKGSQNTINIKGLRVTGGSPQNARHATGEAIHKLPLEKAGGRYWWKAMPPDEGLETLGTGKPGTESVVDKNISACLASISLSSGNCSQSTGKDLAYWLLLPLSKCGYQADEWHFGDICGTIRKEKLCFETSRPDICKSKVIGGHFAHKVLGGMWLTHISMKPTQRKVVDPSPAPSCAKASRLDFFTERYLPLLLLPV